MQQKSEELCFCSSSGCCAMYNWLWNYNLHAIYLVEITNLSIDYDRILTIILGFSHSCLLYINWRTYKVVIAGELVTLGWRWFGRVFGLFGCLGVERCLGDEAGGAPELVLCWVGAAVRLTGRFHRHLLPEHKRNICHLRSVAPAKFYFLSLWANGSSGGKIKISYARARSAMFGEGGGGLTRLDLLMH